MISAKELRERIDATLSAKADKIIQKALHDMEELGKYAITLSMKGVPFLVVNQVQNMFDDAGYETKTWTDQRDGDFLRITIPEEE